MKILKWILATVFWLLIIALLVAPLGLIWQISQKEQEAYMAPEAPVLQEAAVGGLAQAYRRDVSEYIVVDGTFTSTEHVYMDLNAKQAASIRWLVGIGDEVRESQLLGTYKGKEILSTVTGVLVEMNTYAEEPYLRFQLLSPVVLEARVEDRVLSILKRSGSLATEDGEAVGLVFASARKNQDGTTSVRLSIDSDRYVYGQAVSDLRIMTGTVYRRALVLSRE